MFLFFSPLFFNLCFTGGPCLFFIHSQTMLTFDVCFTHFAKAMYYSFFKRALTTFQSAHGDAVHKMLSMFHVCCFLQMATCLHTHTHTYTNTHTHTHSPSQSIRCLVPLRLRPVTWVAACMPSLQQICSGMWPCPRAAHCVIATALRLAPLSLQHTHHTQEFK